MVSKFRPKHYTAQLHRLHYFITPESLNFDSFRLVDFKNSDLTLLNATFIHNLPSGIIALSFTMCMAALDIMNTVCHFVAPSSSQDFPFQTFWPLGFRYCHFYHYMCPACVTMLNGRTERCQACCNYITPFCSIHSFLLNVIISF